MAVMSIVIYTENKAALRQKSKPVKHIDGRVKRLIRDLKDTINNHPDAIGLAAPQINFHSRVVVVRLGGNRDNDAEPDPPIALINPRITEAGDEKPDFDGCLSFPGLYAETVRPHRLKAAFTDEDGNRFHKAFEGFDAVVVHHEIDHLDGKLFIDHLVSIDSLYRIQMDEQGKWACARLGINY